MTGDEKNNIPVGSLAEQNSQTRHENNPDKQDAYQEKMKELEIHLEYYKKNAECLQKNRDKLIREIEELENHSEDVKDKLVRIANTKPYRIAYVLRRFTLEFRHGTLQDKKNFLKWVLFKIIRRENELKFKYNPLFEIAWEDELKNEEEKQDKSVKIEETKKE